MKSNFEFTTTLSITTCENRLEDLGAFIYQDTLPGAVSKVKSTAFTLKHPKSSSLNQYGLSGELQEIKNGTLIKAEFYPSRNFGYYIVFIILFFYLLYSKNYGFIFLPIVLTLINTVIIQSYRSSWDYLERKVVKSLTHWKKE